MFGVLEIQLISLESMAILTNTYTDMNAALAKFYQTMVSATQSTCLRHSAVLIDEVGNVIKQDTVYHDPVTPEVES